MSRLNRRNKESVMGDGANFWHIETFAEMVGMTIPEAIKYITEKKIRTKRIGGYEIWVSPRAFDGLEIKKTLAEL